MFAKREGFCVFRPFLGNKNKFQIITAADEVRLGLLCNASQISLEEPPEDRAV